MKRVSDIITKEEIRNWKANEIITISAGMGSGKSYFIKNILYEYCKENNYKILYLIHRNNCKNQFSEEIKGKEDVIELQTYQYIEEMYRHNLDFDFSRYKYIVCDEYQYFCGSQDNDFNNYIDISFEKIINSKNNVKIFMSATGNDIKSVMKINYKIKYKDYKIKPDYSYIKKIKYFNKDDTIDELLKECISKNQKAIVFMDSAEKCYKKYLLFKKYSLFNCSKNNKKFYKYVDEEKINNMLYDEMFKENILFTTCCLDAGVNIIDKQVKGIILDVKNTNTLMQCVGRRRVDRSDIDDKIYLYIKNRNKFDISNMLKSINRQLEKPECLMFNNYEFFINKYKRNCNCKMIYDTIDDDGEIQKKVNMLMFYSCINRKIELESMKESNYIKVVNKMFGKKKSCIIEEEKSLNYLERYLNSIVGKRLYKKEQEELINMLNLKDSRGRLQRKVTTLSGYMIDNFNMILISKRVKEDNKLKTIWFVNNI